MTDFETTMGLVGEAAMACLDAETVVYTPRVGEVVSRSAVIERMGPQMVGPMGVLPLARVSLRNDAASGRLASAIDTGGDTITWAPKRGGVTRPSRVLEIVTQNGGFVTVLIG